MKTQSRVKYKQLVKLFENMRQKQIRLLLLCILADGLNLYMLFQIQGFVDLVTGRESFEKVLQVFLRIVLIGLLFLIAQIIQANEWQVFRHSVINQMRTMMYRRLLTWKAAFFDKRTTGDIVSSVMEDGSMIAQNAGISILMLILNLFKLIVVAGVLLYENMVMGLAAILICTAYFFVNNQINKTTRERYQEFSQEEADLTQHVSEDTKAVLEIKTLNEKAYFNQKLENHVWERYFKAVKKVIHIDTCSTAAISVICALFPLLMVLMGGIFLYHGEITVGTIILFYTYSQEMIEPLRNLADFYRGRQKALGSAERIYDYLFTDENEGKTSLDIEGTIDLSIDINRFAWADKTILQDIHETYQAGDCIFVKGDSGTGKTTLLRLICGFYPIQDGAICINRKAVDRIREESLFEVVKILFQEPVILEGTLRENIVLGEDYSDDEIMTVLERVQLKELAIERGLGYLITEAGKNLSGGQKQRLALARILIRRPKILIMDEATNGLDADTEELVIKSIKKYIEESSSILIVTSHKEALQRICNKTIVLQHVS